MRMGQNDLHDRDEPERQVVEIRATCLTHVKLSLRENLPASRLSEPHRERPFKVHPGLSSDTPMSQGK